MIYITKEKDWFFSFSLGKGWFAIDLPFLSIFIDFTEVDKNERCNE